MRQILTIAVVILIAAGLSPTALRGEDAADPPSGSNLEKLGGDGGGVGKGASPADLPMAPPFTYVPLRPVEPPKEHFHWKPALRETLMFATLMHVERLSDPDTIPELKGPLFKDYFRSVANLHGWDDWDPILIQYVGHSFHGATDSRIELQNNPNGRAIDWGEPGYWHSRFVAMAWNAFWGAQFKIGLYSETMIGNVGLPNQYRERPLPRGADYGRMAWSEFFVNPIGGSTWVITEDVLDRYVVRRLEPTANRHAMYVVRSFLTPSRAWANLLRFKRPWYRETRDIHGDPTTER